MTLFVPGIGISLHTNSSNNEKHYSKNHSIISNLQHNESKIENRVSTHVNLNETILPPIIINGIFEPSDRKNLINTDYSKSEYG